MRVEIVFSPLPVVAACLPVSPTDATATAASRVIVYCRVPRYIRNSAGLRCCLAMKAERGKPGVRWRKAITQL